MSKVIFFEDFFTSQESYFQVLNALNDLIFAKGPGSRMIWANRAFCDYRGINNEQIREHLKTLTPLDPTAFTHQYERDDAYVFETGKVLNIPQEPILGKNGDIRYFNTIKSPIFDADGKVIMIVGTSRDITETLQMKEVQSLNVKLLEAVKAAQDASEAKSLFLANISHELRTPMHGILSFAQFGQEHVLTESAEVVKSYFNEIYDSGSKLMTLLNQLLDLSTLEANRVTYTFSKHELMDALNPVLNELSNYAKEKNLNFEIDTAVADLTANFDLEKITQVVRNLVSNAIKFSNDNSTIRIGLEEANGKVTCSVLNTGVGIPENEIELIFEKFIQGSRTRSRAGGTGLGLAICKEIVIQHQGKIWANSGAGGETKIFFELPKTR